MKLIRKSRLKFQQGNSDKVYQVDLIETSTERDNRYLVNFRYGRRGSNLREGTKTPDPVTFEKAEKLFDSIVISKVNKGYNDEKQSTSSQQTGPLSSSDHSKQFSIDKAFESYQQRLSKLVHGALNDEQAKRLIWRIGELGYRQAGLELSKLIGLKSDEFDYILAWTLGRLKSTDYLQNLIRLAEQSKSPSTQRMALEAALWIAPSDRRYDLLKEISQQLPNYLLNTFNLESLQTNLNTNQLTEIYLRYLDTNEQYADFTLTILFQLSLIENQSISLAIRDVIKQAIAKLTLKPPYFKTIRHLLKTAEFRLDGEIYGLIAQKIDSSKSNYFIDGWSEYTVVTSPRYEWVKINDEQKKADSRLAFSNKTRQYLKRRTWRTLRRMGQAHDPRYVRFAVDILSTYDELSQGSAQQRTQYEYDPRTWERREVSTTHYDEFASQNLLNHLTRQNNPDVEPTNSYAVWKTTGQQSSFNGRGEAFPELWDEEPEALLKLLCKSSNPLVQNFSARALLDHKAFCEALENEQLCELLERPFLAAQQLAVNILKHSIEKKQPSNLLLIALAACLVEEGRLLAINWLNKHLDWLQDNTLVLAKFFLIEHKEVVQWLPTISLQFTDNHVNQKLIEHLTESLTTQYAKQHQQDLLTGVFERLYQCFPSAVAQLNLARIEELMQYGISLQVFAARLLEKNQCSAEEIPSGIFQALIQSEVVLLKSSGVSLFAKLPAERIAQQLVTLLSFCTASDERVRTAAVHSVKKLKLEQPHDAELLYRDLVDKLFQSEPFEGVHNSLISLLTGTLKDFSVQIDQQLFWRLSQAKSHGAKLFAAALIGNFDDANFSIRQWAVLANQESRAIRTRAIKFFKENIVFVKERMLEALPLLNSQWDDSKEFALDYFKTQFEAEDWSPEVMVGICDNPDNELQDLGRDLIINHFDIKKGHFYLTRLSQHPSVKVQLFVTQLLPDFVDDSVDSLRQLKSYFITVLSQVKKGRIAKDRVLQFLQLKAQLNIENATFVASILTRVSATAAIQEKASYLIAMRDLKQQYPHLDLPIKIKQQSEESVK